MTSFTPDPQTKSWLDNIIANATLERAVPNHAVGKGDVLASSVKQLTGGWKLLESEQRVLVGMNFLMSGLLAASSWRQFTQSVSPNDVGDRKIEPTHLGLGIVLAVLAAGSAYLGIKPLKQAITR